MGQNFRTVGDCNILFYAWQQLFLCVVDISTISMNSLILTYYLQKQNMFFLETFETDFLAQTIIFP